MITRNLNERKVSSRKKQYYGWCTSTITRLLRNEKYIGKYIWNKTTTKKDPLTGKRKQVSRPESEWVILDKPELRIIDQETWDIVQKKLEKRKLTSHNYKNKEKRQHRVTTDPTHLLSGNLKCGVCGGNMSIVTGKNSGYYGCLNKRRNTCTNKLLINRKQLEEAFMKSLKEKVLNSKSIYPMLEIIHKEIKKNASFVPEPFVLKSLIFKERKLAYTALLNL